MEISQYTSRTAVADIDCLAICPVYPDFVIYGTYSIVKRTEDQEYASQVRTGSLQTISVSPVFEQAYAGMLLPKLAGHNFPAAVLDIRFHPNDGSLLGTALSNGTIHFFRFIKYADVLGRCVVTELLPLGHVVLHTPEHETEITLLVTQFQWLPQILEVGRRDVSNTLTVIMAATLSSGEVKMVKTKILGIRSVHDHRLTLPPSTLEVKAEASQAHSLEAWCTGIIHMPTSSPDSPLSHLILSGGDDSTLLSSIVTFNTSSHVSNEPLFNESPIQPFKDGKSHNAGVTAILALPSPTTHPPSPLPFLTGSYDETLRLFALAPLTLKRTLHTSLPLSGGVWRIQLMDTYTLLLLQPSPQSSCPGSSRKQQIYILLISCMHAGAKIIRISHSSTKGWEMQVSAEFTKGHSTLVYACDFRKEWSDHAVSSKDKEDRDKKVGRYTIISTGFYDRQICNWEWRDEMRKDAVR